MREDVSRFADEGASAIVTGVLKRDSTLDRDRMSELRDLAGGIPMVCHRCFDVTPNLSDSLETLVKLRYSRVLSSGGHNTALEGKEVLRELIRKAAGRIEVLPGSGIRASNVAELAAFTHCNQVHATAFEPGADPTTTNGSVDYGPFKKVSPRIAEEFVKAARG
jgi:copper homeostasis protein